MKWGKSDKIFYKYAFQSIDNYINFLKEGINTIKEIDDSCTSLKK